MLLTTLLAQEAQARVASDFFLVATGGAILLAIAFLVWCLVKPKLGRIFAFIFALLGIVLGAGLLAWGIVAACVGGTVPIPLGFVLFVSEASEAIGFGAGCLAASITALVLASVAGCTSRCGGQGQTTC